VCAAGFHSLSVCAARTAVVDYNTTTACIKCAAGQYIGMGAVACRDCIVGTADTGPKTATACQTCSAVSFTAASNTVMCVLAAKLIATAARVPAWEPSVRQVVHGQAVNSPMPLHRLDTKHRSRFMRISVNARRALPTACASTTSCHSTARSVTCWKAVSAPG
jgi:hypothetical protein